jgi:hypothetical protein
MKDSLRGPVSLHASAVCANGRALVFLGPSETGKTSMCLLLSEHTRALALDAVYLIPRLGGWEAVKGDGRAHGRPISQQEVAVAKSTPVQAIFRLYQARVPRLKAITPLQTCRYLTDALFEITRHRQDDLETKRSAFSNLAKIARAVPGYEFYFDLSPQTIEALNNMTHLW